MLVGIDIGRYEDLTALVFVEKQDDKFIVRKCEAWRNVSYAEQEKRMQYYFSKYMIENANIDATGLGEHLAENLSRKFTFVHPVKFTHELKEKLVLNLKRMMQNGKIVLPDNPKLINSIRAIKRRFTEGNIIKFEADRRHDIGHADLFWALALAVFNIRGKSSLPQVVKLENW